MLRVTVAAVAILVSQAALAANPTCEAQATEKKLAGAAKTSFVTKCEKDMKAATAKTCDAQAAEKKLSGAAKTSFTKKCVADATAPAPAPAK
jgi:curli biogenesis system outer membrane secretion channel CsgG